MKINELEGLDYYINEVEAFGKSVFNPAEYTVTLAVEAGTLLNNYIKEGQQVSGSYDANGTTTNFESLVQDIGISRQFQAGYDMYNLTLSENVLNVARESILDVPDGGTGTATLNGVLKGNGTSPVSTAVDGVDYWSPATKEPVTLNGEWMVEHLGGSNYRLSQVYTWDNVPINSAHQGQYISPALELPALPVGFSDSGISFQMITSPDVSQPWWLFSQASKVRVKCGASVTGAKVVLMLTCLTTKS